MVDVPKSTAEPAPTRQVVCPMLWSAGAYASHHLRVPSYRQRVQSAAALERRGLEVQSSPMRCRVGVDASCAAVVLPRRGRLARHAPVTTPLCLFLPLSALL